MNNIDENQSKSILPKAMVFAAGYGTRLRPITNIIPKPLVKIAGKTLIDYTLDRLKRLEVEEVVVNVHYLADKIEDHLSHRTTPKIQISDERIALLETGGGLMFALPKLGENPFYILNSDNIWIDRNNENLVRLSETWDANNMDMLLMLASSYQNHGYFGTGDFIADKHGKLRRKSEQDSSALIYTGVGIVHPRAFLGSKLGKFSLNEIFDKLITKDRLYGMQMTGRWFHIGVPQVIPVAEEMIISNVNFCEEENL